MSDIILTTTTINDAVHTKYLHRTPLLGAAQSANHRVLHVLHRDYETRGQLDLKTVGIHRYAGDAQTSVLCCAFAVDDGPVQLWARVIRFRRNFLRLQSIQLGQRLRTTPPSR